MLKFFARCKNFHNSRACNQPYDVVDPVKLSNFLSWGEKRIKVQPIFAEADVKSTVWKLARGHDWRKPADTNSQVTSTYLPVWLSQTDVRLEAKYSAVQLPTELDNLQANVCVFGRLIRQCFTSVCSR